MKRLLNLFLLLMVLEATAQKHTLFGALHGGFSSAQSYDAKLSSGLGIELELPLGERAYLVTRPTLNFRGFNGSYNGLLEVKSTYMDLPLTLEALLGNPSKMNLYAGAGVYYGLALSGKIKTNPTFLQEIWTPMKFGEGDTDDRSKTDFGINLNGGVRFSGGNRVAKIGIQTQWGTKNVAPKARQDDAIFNTQRLRNISLYVAIALL